MLLDAFIFSFSSTSDGSRVVAHDACRFRNSGYFVSRQPQEKTRAEVVAGVDLNDRSQGSTLPALIELGK
jgi:hypothetical protein